MLIYARSTCHGPMLLRAIIQNTSCRLSHISVTAATSTEGRDHLTFSPAEKNQSHADLIEWSGSSKDERQ
ncbi:hypothetical protein GB937_006841 [Aspergillus fischeri]|nr:hypothetical protein GB937_006841 [Aspergillus fischeri]